jgi:hypothetical protein
MKFENITVISWDIFDENENCGKNLSHCIIIPNNIMDTFFREQTNIGTPIFIQIRDMDTAKLCKNNNFIVFSDIEVTDKNICVLPFWAMSKLELQQFDKISIENINCLEKIAFIKLKANNSNYVYWDDIKKMLEDELQKYQCLSIGDLIYLADVEFYVKELQDINTLSISNGSLFDTEPSIEFEMPTDVEHIETIKSKNIKNQIHIPKTIEELVKDDNSNSPALSYTLTFHTGEEIKLLEKYYLEQKIISKNKN